MKRRQFTSYKDQAIELRRNGKSYGEIQTLLGFKIPKSTLALWCKGLMLSKLQFNRIENRIRRGGEIGRATALAQKRHFKNQYFKSLFAVHSDRRNDIFRDKEAAKTILAVLYLAEGSKHQSGSMMFGNSNPGIIQLFMELMRFVYEIDNTKFRCTVQCRADQNIPKLESFWSQITKVPLKQFYKARVDPRSIGAVTLKKDYKAVCRIDYFSSSVYNDLLVAGRVMSGEKYGPMA